MNSLGDRTRLEEAGGREIELALMNEGVGREISRDELKAKYKESNSVELRIADVADQN